MVKLNAYLSRRFSISFLTLFIPFFVIITLVYLIKIAALTKQIELSFVDMLTMYFYNVPDIIFYTLPLSFVAALANTFSRLSSDNESISLFAMGITPRRLLRPFFLLSLLFSLLLLSISFAAMPLSKNRYKNFKEEKKAHSKLHITPGKIGQKFADYYIYVKSQEGQKLKDVVIYTRNAKGVEEFFSAHYAKLKHSPAYTSLMLINGFGYTYSEEKLRQAIYQTLEVFETPKVRYSDFNDIVGYWMQARTDKHIRGRAFFFFLVSLIPLLSFYFIAALTIHNPRYEEAHSYSAIAITSLFFYTLASFTERRAELLFFIVVVTIALSIGYVAYRYKITRRF